MEIKKLIVLSDSELCRKDNLLYGHPALIEYFEGLCNYFKVVHLFSKITQKFIKGWRPVSHPKLIIHERKDDKINIRNFWKKLEAIRTSIDKDSAVLVFPNEWTLLSVLLSPKSGRLALYLGKLREEVNAELRRKGIRFFFLSYFLHILLLVVLKKTDLVFYRGEGLGAWVRGKVKFAGKSNPISLFGPDNLPPPSKRREDSIFRILIVSELTERKCPLKGLLVLKELIKLNPKRDFRISFVGQGPLKRAVKREASLLNLGKRVDFWPFTSDISELSYYYANSDLLLFVGKGPEGLPRVIDESLLHSLPVVTTVVGGIKEEFRESKEVVLVESNNPRAISLAANKIINDSDFRACLIGRGLKRAYSLFSQKASAQHAQYLKGEGVDKD